jgi:nitric oxide reductase NorQ protein
MANIPALPTGRVILDAGKPKQGASLAYGPGGCSVLLTGTTLDLRDSAGQGIAAVKQGIDGYVVDLDRVDPDSVGYVNRFIADWGLVKRDWRTKTYRLVSGLTNDLAEAVEQAPPMPRTVVPPAPAPVVVTAPVEVVAPTVVAAPATVLRVVPSQDLDALIPAPERGFKARPKVVAGEDIVVLDKVHVPAKFVERMDRALRRRQRGERAAVMVTGPSGTAKTLLVRKFAALHGLPFIIISGGKVRTADDWFGGLKQDHDTGQFAFKYNPFGAALKLGRQCIVLLDEGNRAETPQALNAVLSLLDDTGRVWSPDANEWFELPVGMLVVMTANIGSEYVATQPMDAAVVQRFGTGVRLGYPTAPVETEVLMAVTGLDRERAKTLVAMAGHQRPLKDDLMKFPSGTGISPRMLVDIATEMQDGASDREAVDTVFDVQFPTEDAEALGIVVDTYFPKSAASTLDVDTAAVSEADDI